MVIPCIWNMVSSRSTSRVHLNELPEQHHNEDEFPNSYVFDPERFMRKSPSPAAPDSLTEGHYGFGFGRHVCTTGLREDQLTFLSHRRKCPGQYMAAKTIWIAVVRLLWAFSIEPAKDSAGQAVHVDPANCTSGMTS